MLNFTLHVIVPVLTFVYECTENKSAGHDNMSMADFRELSGGDKTATFITQWAVPREGFKYRVDNAFCIDNDHCRMGGLTFTAGYHTSEKDGPIGYYYVDSVVRPHVHRQKMLCGGHKIFPYSQDIKKTYALSYEQLTRPKNSSRCLSNMGHTFASSGYIPLAGALGKGIFKITWGNIRPSETLGLRKRRTIVKCPTVTAGIIVHGGQAFCNLGGIEDDLESQIQKAFDKTQTEIKKVNVRQKAGLKQLRTLLDTAHKSIENLKQKDSKLTLSAMNLEKSFNEFFSATARSIKQNAAVSKNRYMYLTAAIGNIQIHHEVSRLLDRFDMVSRTVQNGNCDDFIKQVKTASENRYGFPHLLNKVKSISLDSRATTASLHRFVRQLHTVSQGVVEMLEGTVKYDGKSLQFMGDSQKENHLLFQILNSEIKNDSSLIVSALTHRQLDMHIGWLYVIAGAAVILLFGVMKRDSTMFNAVVMIQILIIGVFMVIQGLASVLTGLFSFLTWLF